MAENAQDGNAGLHGLVLEGGGMRGLYTAGVLEYFLENGLFFDYIVGVSAGACIAASYISRQRGRNKKVNLGYVGDPRYLSLRNLLREKSLFGMDFIFHEIPHRLEPFDFAAFRQAPERFVIGTTDAHSGSPVYFEKVEEHDILQVVRASSSLPFLSRPVALSGRLLFDGGISDPIPLQKAVADGTKRQVVVLTQPAGYRKKPFKLKRLASLVYPAYPGLVQALGDRYRVYNESLDAVERLAAQGTVRVIRPSRDLQIGRTEKNPDKLSALYELGFRDAQAAFAGLRTWLA